MAITIEDLRTRCCLIIQGDDLGMCHSINQACFYALNEGIITSASIMAPCPWLQEVADFARKHSSLDIGMHLTLTSECPSYKWRPLSSSAHHHGLTDKFGNLPESVEGLVNQVQSIEYEALCQFRAIRALGIEPTHIDSHMLAAFSTPRILTEYLRLAMETDTLALVPKSQRIHALSCLPAATHVIPTVNFIGASRAVPADRWLEFYTSTIDKLEIGMNVLSVHLGYDDAELRAVRSGRLGWDAAWRQRDLDAMANPAFRQALKINDVVLMTWRDLASVFKISGEALRTSEGPA